MAEYRWYDVLNEITKVERKYNIKNPNWDNGFPGVFRDYGFVPVDSKGDWWTRIPDAPELPIIYAPVANTSYTVPTGIGTTTTTGIADSVNVIIDGTYTELPTGETVAAVTTGGVVTSVSSAVGTAAAGAAIGFGVGVGWFEAAPEFWTKVSNTVFGTDLDPDEIGQMARDTNALVVIKDGIVFMAEDMINAIRNAFFDNGAEGYLIPYEPDQTPPTTGETVDVTISSYPTTTPCTEEDFKALFSEFNINWDSVPNAVLTQFYSMVTDAANGFFNINTSKVTYNDTGKITKTVVFAVGAYPYPKSAPTLPIEGKLNKMVDSDGAVYYNGTISRKGYSYYEYRFIYDTNYNGFTAYAKSSRQSSSVYTLGKYHKVSHTASTNVDSDNLNIAYWNATNKGIAGITPTGNQGTKDQPIATLFPDWVSKGIETIAGDGVTKVKWLPVSLPSNKPLIDGIPFNTNEAQNGTLPDNYTETANQLGENVGEQTKNAPSYPTPPITPVPDVTPTPDDPAISGGGGSATGLANLYNPTLAQVKQFSRWLWGSDGLNLDQLKKLLQDPMQAIIGLHVMYATPTTGADRDIQVGYINSGVTSKIVTEQYTEIDCGTVTINEYFGDARDYSPFTQVYCYLPFIGIVELNADDVVNSTLGIKYKIDVLTGCCLAQLTVKKYALDAVLYTYTGNCAVQMPITSGNYLSTVSSLLGAVVSGAAAVATGGALAPVAIGAAANALGGGARASVAMSGSLGSNAGAMGIRKPYLIIKRVESADANGYNEFYGYPTNKRVNLSQLTGYVRVKEINLSGTNATEDEQNEIVNLLKEGVIL